MDYLELNERIQLAIKIGESQYREFKSALDGAPGSKKPRPIKDVKDDISRTLVAFANADGGELLIGVEDDGEVTGVPYDEASVAQLLDATATCVHKDTPLPSPRKAKTTVDGKLLVYFAVPKGTQFVHITSDGRCLKRVDRDSIPHSAESITSQRIEDQSRTWDRSAAVGATLIDLDIDLVKEVANQIAYGISAEKCLQYLDLAEFTPDGLKLRNAAVALFAKDMRRWHPRCQVRIMTVRGSEKRSGEAFNVIKDDVAAANVLKLVDLAWERLTASLTKSMHLTDQARFQHEYLYPQIACREALINAIAHRNYAIDGRGIEIALFPDRLEIASPGSVLSTISLDDIKALKGVHESRNPLICRVLREVGLMREMGEGVRRIFDVMRSNALAEPEMESDKSSFTVTLYHKSLYDPAVKLWLSQFERFKLTENQRAILALGFNNREFSTQSVVDRLGIVDMDEVRELLTPLRKAQLLVRTKTKNQIHVATKQLQIPAREIPSWRVQMPMPISSETSPPHSAGDQQPRFAPPRPTAGTGVTGAHDRSAPSASGADDDSDVDGIGVREVSLFIGNLHYGATREELYKLLTECVEIVELQMPAGAMYGSVNRGYAFAIARSAKDPVVLVKELDGLRLRERRMHVRLQMQPPTR